jgi:hypothetical protein
VATNPIPEPMYVALARLMQAVVDRDQEDYQGPIALPPCEHYDDERVLTADSASPGFTLELWYGERGADTSLIGYLEPRGDGTYDVLLRDIIP